ncbi:MAG: hypothetical protein J7L75_00095 [Thermoproteales archaeon]|nr:hypothetical protein [Thermoproteales archaeon]
MVMGITAWDVVELFRRGVKAGEMLAELPVSELDVGLAAMNAVLRDVATKQDLAELGGAWGRWPRLRCSTG